MSKQCYTACVTEGFTSNKVSVNLPWKRLISLAFESQQGGYEPNLKNWKPYSNGPSPRADIRSFTGFTNFYQKFVPNYANIVAPISSLLRKEVEWVWGDAQQNAFDTVI